MLGYVVVPFLLFLGQSSGSVRVDISGLTRRGVGKSMPELDKELEEAIKEGISDFDVCIIATSSQVAKMDSRDVVKKALRMDYRNILLCAQSKFLRNWEDQRGYHWFYAKSFGMPWFRKDLWDDMVFNWEAHWEDILNADNVEFFNYARENLSISYLNTDALAQAILESIDAVKIIQHLGMDINPRGWSIDTLVSVGCINTLRLLHEDGVRIFENSTSLVQTVDPDKLDFFLSVDKGSVDTREVVTMAIELGLLVLPDILEIIYHWQQRFPLEREDLTRLAKKGNLSILKWAHSVDPTMRPSKNCMSDIMIQGHVEVLEFLYSLDKAFLPGPYQETEASWDTMWHFDAIAKLYEIDSSLVPLELLHRHAMNLRQYKVAIWTGNKLHETTGEVIVTKKDLRAAIKLEKWSFVLWAMEKDPKLMPSRAELMIKKTRFRHSDSQLEAKWKFLVILNQLYEQTSDRQYLPTVKELENQPVEYVWNVHVHAPGYLSHEDLQRICASKETGVDVHEWLFELGVNVATVEMANAAARVGSIEALDWIVEQNPEAFPSRDSTKTGVRNSQRRVELVEWICAKRPELLPDWELYNHKTIPMPLLQRWIDHRKERETKERKEQENQEKQEEQMDQEEPEDSEDLEESEKSAKRVCSLLSSCVLV